MSGLSGFSRHFGIFRVFRPFPHSTHKNSSGKLPIGSLPLLIYLAFSQSHQLNTMVVPGSTPVFVLLEPMSVSWRSVSFDLL